MELHVQVRTSTQLQNFCTIPEPHSTLRSRRPGRESHQPLAVLPSLREN